MVAVVAAVVMESTTIGNVITTSFQDQSWQHFSWKEHKDQAPPLRNSEQNGVQNQDPSWHVRAAQHQRPFGVSVWHVLTTWGMVQGSYCSTGHMLSKCDSTMPSNLVPKVFSALEYSASRIQVQ